MEACKKRITAKSLVDAAYDKPADTLAAKIENAMQKTRELTDMFKLWYDECVNPDTAVDSELTIGRYAGLTVGQLFEKFEDEVLNRADG